MREIVTSIANVKNTACVGDVAWIWASELLADGEAWQALSGRGLPSRSPTSKRTGRPEMPFNRREKKKSPSSPGRDLFFAFLLAPSLPVPVPLSELQTLNWKPYPALLREWVARSILRCCVGTSISAGAGQALGGSHVLQRGASPVTFARPSLHGTQEGSRGAPR